MSEVPHGVTESLEYVVSHWSRSTLRRLPRYWPFIRYISIHHETIHLHIAQQNHIVLHIHEYDKTCTHIDIIHDNDDTNTQEQLCHIQLIMKKCNLYRTSHVNVSLLVFVEGICNVIYNTYVESLNFKHILFLSRDNVRDGFEWNEGCDLLLFIFCSSSEFGGVKASLKPFPEFDRIEEKAWKGSASDIKEITFSVSSLQNSKIETIEDIFHLDQKTQLIPKWIERFQNSVVKLKRRDVPDPQIYAGAWKVPDYQFDVELLPDPYFESLCSKHSTFLAYHGSPMGNWYSIIRNGLEIRSWTSQMKNGAMLGSGIYFSGDVTMALLYSQAQTGWNQCSLGKCLEIVGVYEIAACPDRVHKESKSASKSNTDASISSTKSPTKPSIPIPRNYIVVEDNELVRLKSLLVWKKRDIKQSKLCTRLFISLLFICILILICILLYTLVKYPSIASGFRTSRIWRRMKRFFGI